MTSKKRDPHGSTGIHLGKNAAFGSMVTTSKHQANIALVGESIDEKYTSNPQHVLIPFNQPASN